MKNIYQVSNEEAKRIRLLHETESKNKKIDSTLLKEEGAGGMCGGNHPCTGPSGKSVSWQGCPNSPNLLNPFPCAMIDGQTPNSSHIGKYVGLPNLGFCGKVTAINNHTLPTGSVSCPPTGLVLGTDCDNCYTTTGGGTSFNCNNGNCIGVNGTSGQYSSMSDCQDDCADPIKYSCNNGNCVQDPNGQYTTLSNCEDNCDPLPSLTYNCSPNGSCVPVQGAGGQFLTLSDCAEECKYEGNWRCKKLTQDQPIMMGKELDKAPGTKGGIREQIGQASLSAAQLASPTSGHYCVKDPNGPYQTKQACESNCPERRDDKLKNCINCEEGQMTQTQGSDCPPGFSQLTNLSQAPCTECQQGNCINVGWSFGPGFYNSMTECQASPLCSVPTEYECVNNACAQQPGGQYTTLADCQNSPCPAVPVGWECDNSNGCSQTPTGTYQSQAACETACCDDIIANWGWNINNPNATGNQACQRLYNQFGSATPGPQPVFSDNCMYNFLMNIVNTQGGCGNTNFMNLLESFAGTPGTSGNNGCYGNPASGCAGSTGAPFTGAFSNCPHQNSVCGKKDFFCSNINSYQSWWKCAWSTDFAAGLVTGPGGPPYSNQQYPCSC
tara:strand:- start:107 stop:1933 length:1827 start_codon:yes stop_codon:yes gene_type:complete